MSRTSSPTTSENVGFLLAKASQRFNELIAERFAEHGFGDVRASYGSVLIPLFERDGLRLGELASAARLSKQAMTGLVKRCEAHNLVERARDPGDGRAFNVRLTGRGRAFQGVVDRILRELDAELERSLGKQERDALTRALKGVMDL